MLRTATFNVQAFLDSAGVAGKVVEFPKHASIFTQGKHTMCKP
jgi:hypothetical protein